jgi:adenylate kinase
MDNISKTEAIKQWLGNGSINIFGRPFAGKDYQGRKMIDIFGGHLLGGGDILRNSQIPDEIRAHMNHGMLIPSASYVEIVLPYLMRDEFANQPLILSSVGRWKGEEDGVIRSLEAAHHPLKAVIYLRISNNESHDRWLGRDIFNDRQARHDDTEATLQTRFQEFDTKTMPVIEYYRQIGLLLEIDGTKSRDQVTSDIIDALYQKLS